MAVVKLTPVKNDSSGEITKINCEMSDDMGNKSQGRVNYDSGDYMSAEETDMSVEDAQQTARIKKFKAYLGKRKGGDCSLEETEEEEEKDKQSSEVGKIMRKTTEKSKIEIEAEKKHEAEKLERETAEKMQEVEKNQKENAKREEKKRGEERKKKEAKIGSKVKSIKPN